MTYTDRRVSGESTAARHEGDAFPRQVLATLLDFRNGNFAVRLPSGLPGIEGRIADVFNEIATISARRASEIARISHMVGTAGRIKERASMVGMVGSRADGLIALN